jgi:RHS repeat-associated protein
MMSSSGGFLDFGYDEIGNLTYKSDVGAYSYDATKKHAVVAAGANRYEYDANGAVVNASGTTIAWSSFDLPTRIAHPSGNYSTFDYGPDRARIRQVARAGGETIETIYAAGGLYERVTRGGATSRRHYIVADGRRVAVHTRVSGSAPTTVYLLEDHLGGVDGFMSSSGALLSRTSNQPFGARRSGDWVGSTPTSEEWKQVQSTTPRGFTDQEHVDNLGVIHMNGRVYDPVLGRFLSPDPLVQAPYDSQTWNRYSYARNNPLRYTDPSGFCFNGHPAGDMAAESCFRQMMENVLVQASSLANLDFGSMIGFGGGVAASDFAAAGSVSAGDAAFVSAGWPIPSAPENIIPSEEIVVSAARIEPAYSIPIDIGLAVSVNMLTSAAATRAYEATTGLGADAAQHYAELEASSGNSLYSVPGALASLWTPETAPETILVLGAASGLGHWSGRPFWQYFPEGSGGYRSTWLTRGPGWEPPYETGIDAASNLALPSYNPGTAVRAVQPSWHKYVRGPRVVAPQPSFGPGAVGGGREYRVVPFED